MKRILLILLIIFSNINFAQNPQSKRERLKELKIAFISHRLELTPQEAEKFWPIYNKYEEKILAIKLEQLKQKRAGKNATNEEALKLLEKNEEMDYEVLALKKKMRAELIPVIGAEKVITLEKLEHEFRKKLMEKMKEQNQKKR